MVHLGETAPDPSFPPPPEPPRVRWHRVEIHTAEPDGTTMRRAVEGDDAWVAAALRSLADQINPPRVPGPVMRGAPAAAPPPPARPSFGRVIPARPDPDAPPRRDPMSS